MSRIEFQNKPRLLSLPLLYHHHCFSLTLKFHTWDSTTWPIPNTPHITGFWLSLDGFSQQHFSRQNSQKSSCLLLWFKFPSVNNHMEPWKNMICRILLNSRYHSFHQPSCSALLLTSPFPPHQLFQGKGLSACSLICLLFHINAASPFSYQ